MGAYISTINLFKEEEETNKINGTAQPTTTVRLK